MTNATFMQCLLGLQCDNFTMIAADQTNTVSIIVMHDANKLHEVADTLLMGVIGDAGEAIQFSQFVTKNIQLYKMRNKYELNAASAVHFTRKSFADSLKGRGQSTLNLLIAGYDEKEGCQLYSLDDQAACMKLPFATHGYGGLLSLGILDQFYNSSLSEEAAYEVLKMCIHEIHQRLLINLPSFSVKAVCRSGIHDLPAITPDSFK